MSSTPAPRITLSRDFSAFLVELSIALHKHAMYPSGHPSLEPAAEGVARRAARLLEDRELVALGVARRQLIIEGVATDPEQPVLRRLAETLHRHHLGAVSLSRGVPAADISDALRALAADAERFGPLGLMPPEKRPQWPQLRLHPLTFDRLTLVADAPVSRDGPASQAAWRGTELWVGLARAAMAGDLDDTSVRTRATSDEALPIEPAVVAHAIDEHPRAEAYDQVIVGYLLQIAQELKTASGAETAALRRRTARLIAALNPDTLRRLVEMGGNVAQRRAFVLDAAHGMAVDAVLEILKAASDVSGQTISHGLVRMLSKLAAHAELGTDQARPLADTALREQVARLLSGWQLADPNPQAYGRFLQRVTTGTPIQIVSDAAGGDAEMPDSLRMAQMSLELGTTGPLLDRAVDRAVEAGAVGALLQVLASVPAEAGPAAKTIAGRLGHPRTIAKLVAREPIDFDSLDRLLPTLPFESYHALLDTLATSENRTTRRKLLDRLCRTEIDISSLITARLYDDRWYVQRNMLVLLERSGRTPKGFSASTWAEHLDARVRHQAIRLQLTMPDERDHALRTALSDRDRRLVRVALAMVQRTCPPELADLVAALAADPLASEPDRLLAVHALGRCPDPTALDALLRLVDGGKSLLGKPKLAPRTPLILAAMKALAGEWRTDPRATPILALGARSTDPDLRRAAGASRT